MSSLLSSPLFGIAITIAAYELGLFINKKCKSSPIANPLLFAVLIIIPTLLIFKIPLASYNAGGDMISLMLTPVTAVLGLNIYNQRKILQQYFFPVVIGCTVACVFNAAFVLLMCKLLTLDSIITASLLPRSVTTPIALALSGQLGGIPAITMAAVMVTGLTGTILAPYLLKLFRIKNPVAAGIAIGASSHALGTTTAIRLGEVEGAMSGISIGISGILTVILAMLI